LRQASTNDLSPIVATLTSAFLDDPLWGPPFAGATRATGLAIMWQVLVGSALENDWVLVTDSVEAASVWIPPGVPELTADEEQRMHRALTEHTGAASADLVADILEELDGAKPSESCYFLSLLGTHAGHRGKGIGMALLRHGLERVDELGAAAYLESSNPANNPRYLGEGFEVRDVLELPTGQVTTMWRDPR
jgi:GNAT superfamily N-acetyltransferase